VARFEPPEDLLAVEAPPVVQRVMGQLFCDLCLPGRYLESPDFKLYLLLHVAEVVSDLLNCWTGRASVDEPWPVPPPLPPALVPKGHRIPDPSDPDDARLIAVLASLGPELEPMPLPPQIPGWPGWQPYRSTG
jgi:hypothetical protein